MAHCDNCAKLAAEIERLKLQSEHADCWWDDDNRVGSPEEYADEEALKVGEEFELLAAAYWPTKYRVTAVRDHETDEGEYTCELLKGRREEFETYFQIKAERDSLRARIETMIGITCKRCERGDALFVEPATGFYTHALGGNYCDAHTLHSLLDTPQSQAARARRQEKLEKETQCN